MKIVVLSFRSFTRELTVEERRLATEAEAMGHEALVVHAMDLSLELGADGERVLLNGKDFPQADVLIPRARFVDHPEQRLMPLLALEKLGFRTFNSAQAIALAKNKIMAMHKLNEKRLPVPHTIVVEDRGSLGGAFAEIGSVPLVLKPALGTYGQGIYLVDSYEQALALSADGTFETWSPLVMLQEFIVEAAGKDTRVFIAGGEIVGAMERQARAGEFRSNIELGATAKAVEPTIQQTEIALAAVKCMGLDYAGVDLIASSRGPLVLEVNANPGFKTLEQVSGKNIAAAIVKAALSAS